MNLDCSRVTTENSATWVFFLIEYGDSVVLVTLTAVFLSIYVNIERDISRLPASVNYPTNVTVPVVCHDDGWSTNAVIVSVVKGGTVMQSRIRTGCGLALASLAEFLACIVKCGNWTKPFVVSMTTLLCLMKCNPIMNPVKSSLRWNALRKKLMLKLKKILSGSLFLWIYPFEPQYLLYSIAMSGQPRLFLFLLSLVVLFYCRDWEHLEV